MKRWPVRLVAMAVLLLVVAGCDWTQVGMHAGHNLYDPYEPALTATTVGSLTQKFSLSVPNTTNAAPIVAGGRMFLTTFDSSTSTADLHAFDAASGAALWTTTLATDATVARDPVYDNGTVYTLTSTASGSTTNAVSAATGAIDWSVAVPAGLSIADSLVADQGKVFVPVFQSSGLISGLGRFELLALDGATGATVWTWVTGEQGLDAGSYFNATPAVGAGYIALMYNCCVARPGQTPPFPITAVVNESTGSTVNSSASFYESSGRAVGMTTAANGLLYGFVTNALGGGDLFAAFEPTSDWNTPVWASGVSGAFAVSGRSVISTGAGGLNAVDAMTGASQWTTPLPTAVASVGTVVIADHLVYVITSDGTSWTLRTYDAVTGAAVSSLDLGSNATRPTLMVANGFVYFVDGGTITAYAPA